MPLNEEDVNLDWEGGVDEWRQHRTNFWPTTTTMNDCCKVAHVHNLQFCKYNFSISAPDPLPLLLLLLLWHCHGSGLVRSYNTVQSKVPSNKVLRVVVARRVPLTRFK